jgi:hypothetical protein
MESLHFQEIENRSSFVYLHSSSSVSLPDALPPLRQPCSVHPPPPRCSELCHVPSYALPAASSAHAALLLPSPRRAAAARAATRAAGVASSYLRMQHLSRPSGMLISCTTTFVTHLITSFPRHFSFPTTAPHRTSAAASGRRRQPPTPLSIASPALLEHRRNSLQLTDPSNFAFPHPSIIPRSAGELKLRRRSASPLTRRYKAPQPQPRAPAAPHHLVEVF